MADPPYDYAPGSLAALTLTVTPADGTTAATLLVTSPAGVSGSPAVSGSLAGSTWTGTATLPLTTAGVWDVRWTVTGTGTGVRHHRVSVGPTVPQTGRSYATTEDLAKWLEDDPPTGAGKQLRDATREIDDVLLTAVYDVDENGMPTNPKVVTALMEAACAVVEWWDETGDALGAMIRVQSASIGSVTLARGAGSSEDPESRVGHRAVQILRHAGLLGHGPWSC